MAGSSITTLPTNGRDWIFRRFEKLERQVSQILPSVTKSVAGIVAGLQAAVDALTVTQGELETAQGTLATTVADLGTTQAGLATAQGTLTAQQATLTTAVGDIADAQADITTLLGQVLTIQNSSIQANNESLTVLSTTGRASVDPLYYWGSPSTAVIPAGFSTMEISTSFALSAKYQNSCSPSGAILVYQIGSGAVVSFAPPSNSMSYPNAISDTLGAFTQVFPATKTVNVSGLAGQTVKVGLNVRVLHSPPPASNYAQDFAIAGATQLIFHN